MIMSTLIENLALSVSKRDILAIKKMDAMAFARTLSHSLPPKDYPIEIRKYLDAFERELVRKELITPFENDSNYVVVGQTHISEQDLLRRLAIAAQALYFCPCNKNAYRLDPERKPGDSDVFSKIACQEMSDLGEIVAKETNLRITRDIRKSHTIISDKQNLTENSGLISREGPVNDVIEAQDGNSYAEARLGEKPRPRSSTTRKNPDSSLVIGS